MIYPDSEMVGVYRRETPGSPRALFPADADVDYGEGASERSRANPLCHPLPYPLI